MNKPKMEKPKIPVSLSKDVINDGSYP